MDLQLLETGNGGDLNRIGADLALVYSFENMPYLALFGGNKAAVTGPRLATQQDFSWWGNALLFPNNPSLQFNSLTEKALDEIPLTSSGRLLIEEAIKKDLEFMRPFANVSVSTEIVATDHIRIGIGIQRPDNLQRRDFIYIWENGQLSTPEEDYNPNINPPVDEESLQYELQFYL